MQIKTKRKTWSSEEILQLKELYLVRGLSALEISKILQRSKISIWVKTKRLKLHHTPSQTFRIKKENMDGENNPMYGVKGWSKGQTKNTNAILANAAPKISKTRKQLFKDGILDTNGDKNGMFGKQSWSNGLTTETSETLKKMGRKMSVFRKQEWEKMDEAEKQKKRKHCALIGGKCKKKNTSIEIKIEEFLKLKNISYINNYYGGGFVFDFYLPDRNSVIECQGDYWHANPRKYSTLNTNNIQKSNIQRDIRKKEYLANNKIPSLFLWEYDIRRKFHEIQLQICSFVGI